LISLTYLNYFQLNNPVLKLERDVFVYRAYIALKKYGVVINEIHGASPQELQPLKQLAEYFSQPSKR
jgi:poly(A) RNA polymerase GLD2/coatomer protein complex subunit epsilon